MKRYLLLGLIGVLLLTTLTTADDENLPYRKGYLLVKFEDTGPDAPIRQMSSFQGPVSSLAIRDSLAGIIIPGAKAKGSLDVVSEGLCSVKLPEGKSVEHGILDLAISPNVIYAEPDYKIYLNITEPNDPLYQNGNLWGLNNSNDADIDAPEAWDFSTGDANIIVAVTDTGIYYEHPDLNDNMWVNTLEQNGVEGADDDGNGYIDDIHGYDFAGESVETDFYEGDHDALPEDKHYHGTHVAGTIGAVANNGDPNRMVGVCWNVKLMAVKIFADSGIADEGDASNGSGETAFASEAALGITYAANNGANVINASWGGYNYSSAIYNAISNSGVVFVAAARNDGLDNDTWFAYPASYGLSNIISVMATDSSDNIASFTNYGATTVDLAAPGVGIWSTFPVEATDAMTENGYPVSYGSISGTSMAAPHVAGACALLMAVDPNLATSPTGAADVISMVTHPKCVDHLTVLEGRCVSEGRLNLFNAVNMAAANAGLFTDPNGGIYGQRVLNADDGELFTTIQAALSSANLGAGETIIVDYNNWYFENITFPGVDVTLRSGDVNDANVTYDANTTIISDLFGPGGNLVTINQGETTACSMTGFTITDGTVSALSIYNSSGPTINSCIISNNSAYTGGGVDCNNASGTSLNYCIIEDNIANNGGGIYVFNSAIDINNCTITENVVTQVTSGTDGLGGGIYCGTSADANIVSSTISDNTVTGDYTANGGGIYFTDSTPDVNSCTISGNTADGEGGGLYFASGTTPTLINSTILNNTSNFDISFVESGGGGVLWAASSGTIYNNTFTSNSVTSNVGHGGAICFYNAAVDVNDCTFTGNSSSYRGGAIFYGTVTAAADIFDCEFISNTAKQGGAINIFSSSSMVDISNCLFNANTSYASGGAVFLRNSSPDIFNSTFADNLADYTSGFGGAVACFLDSDPVIKNCIFEGNNNGAIAEMLGLAEPNVTYNMFHNNSEGDYYDFVDVYTGYYYDVNAAEPGDDLEIQLPTQASNNYDADPLFVPGRLGNFYLSQYYNDPNLQAYDGNSPAINAGSDTAANLSLDTYHTRTDNVADSGTVDLGYHYNDQQAPGTCTLTVTIPYETFMGTASPKTITLKEFAQVIITALPNTGYEVVSWSGTDDNTSIDTTNYVTLVGTTTSVTLTFQASMVKLYVWVSSGEGSIVSPVTDSYYWNAGEYVEYRRGTEVTIGVDPVNISNEIIWTVTEDSNPAVESGEISKYFTLTLDADFTDVEVEFYAAQTLHVGNDPNGYTDIQEAIDQANSRDIVEISSGDWYSTNGWDVVSKNITLRGQGPDQTYLRMQNVPGEGQYVGPAFSLSNVSRSMRIENLTIEGFIYSVASGTNGDDVDDGVAGTDALEDAESISGTAITCWNAADPTISNVIIRNCGGTAGDGGIGQNGDEQVPTGGDGGEPGFAHGGAMSCWSGSDPILYNVIFENCFAIGGNGGNGGNAWEGGGIGGRPGAWCKFFGDGTFCERNTGRGGAVYIDGTSSAEFYDCIFEGCYSKSGVNGASGQDSTGHRQEPANRWRIDNEGGAIYCDDESSAKFDGCHFEDNYADPDLTAYNPDLTTVVTNDDVYVSHGGAIFIEDNASVEIVDCNFINNYACIGGGVAAHWADNLQIDGSLFSENQAYQGAGIHCIGGTPVISATDFSLNATSGNLTDDPNIIDANVWPDGVIGRGGGVAFIGTSAMIADSTITYNTTNGSGGGIAISSQDVYGNDVTGETQNLIKNCLIVGNAANSYGGGIWAMNHGEPNIINCTVLYNSVTSASGYGGGLAITDHSYANILNTIVWGNNAPGGGSQLAVLGDAEHFSEAKVSYSNIASSDGQANIYFDPDSVLDWNYETNLLGDELNSTPIFVSQQGYYLSQDPCQTNTTGTSPGIDVGSDTAYNLGLYRHTTNTAGYIEGYNWNTGVVDNNNMVDMGFHYLLGSQFQGDFDYDGDVDFNDYSMFTSSEFWLSTDCTFPEWCNGQDLNKDGRVNMVDQAILQGNFYSVDPCHSNIAVDTTAPLPSPSRWEVAPEPNANGAYMKAVETVDNSTKKADIEYLFQRVDNIGVEIDVNSGWIADSNYQVALASNAVYGFKVRARDLSGNMTNWSSNAYVTLGTPSSDAEVPTPSPAQIESVEVVSGNSIRITAVQGTDQSGVYYYFQRHINSGENDYIDPNSGWITSRTWTDTGLSTGTTYSYRVRMRDGVNNTGGWSIPLVNATTLTDGTAPSPAPVILGANWISGVHSITASSISVDNIEENPVEYRFVCYDDGGHLKEAYSSSWLTTEGETLTYNSTDLGYGIYIWEVWVRDPSNNYNYSTNLLQLGYLWEEYESNWMH